MGDQPNRAQDNRMDINNQYNKRYLESGITSNKISKKELIKNPILRELAFNKKINKKINQSFSNNLEKYKLLKINNYDDMLFDDRSFKNIIDIIHYYYYHYDDYITFETVKDKMIYKLDVYQLDIIYDYYISENKIDDVDLSNIADILQDILKDDLIGIIYEYYSKPVIITATNFNIFRINGGQYYTPYFAGIGGFTYSN